VPKRFGLLPTNDGPQGFARLLTLALLGIAGQNARLSFYEKAAA
jgi:hypothetical protein